uniref:Glutaredoxin-C11-like n=3 Tax=Nicotiana TaxID=4085 RepID=A0A1S4ATR3_TOBAC|nr:PREDICTED: glutaredoxin-C11-like [Nicotiana tabacum]
MKPQTSLKLTTLASYRLAISPSVLHDLGLTILMDKIRELASKRAAVIFTKSSCCMCHSIKALFYEIGASPAVHELDQDSRGIEMALALRSLGCNPCVPAIFIGGQFVGSAKDVISLHVDGSLKEMLINAKAIWL